MWFRKKEPATTPDPGEALRAAIRECVDLAVAGDLQGSSASADELLTQLLAAYEQTRPPRARRAWPVVALVLAIALVISALMFLRVPTTEVTLALDLSSLTFRIGSDTGPGGAERVELLGRIHTDQVTIDHVDGVELRPACHLGPSASFLINLQAATISPSPSATTVSAATPGRFLQTFSPS